MDLITGIFIILLIGVNVGQSIFLYLLYQSSISSEKERKELKKWQEDASIHIVKLIYHTSIEIEDYESAERLKGRVQKDFNFYKFNL